MTRRPLLLLAALAACGEPESDAVIEDVRIQADQLVVELSAEPIYGWTCDSGTLVLGQLDSAGDTTRIETDPDRVGDPFDGYWLDGAFRYPQLDEGCDVLSCERLEDLAVGRTMYTQTGTDAPADDTQEYLDTYGWGQTAAESVAVVESAPLEGDIRLTVTYHRSSHCDDTERTDAIELSL